jgi:hypothetical protein
MWTDMVKLTEARLQVLVAKVPTFGSYLSNCCEFISTFYYNNPSFLPSYTLILPIDMLGHIRYSKRAILR